MVTTPAQDDNIGFSGLRNTIGLCGKAVAWLTLIMVLLSFAIVVLRYGFNLGWIWLQESVTYLHVTIFTLVTAWALAQDGHVRVDIFYTRMSAKKRAMVNLAGTVIFLVPFCVFILVTAWPYVSNSWKVLEGSREAGGLPLVFMLKSLILIMPVMLLGQAFISATDAWKTLKNNDA